MRNRTWRRTRPRPAGASAAASVRHGRAMDAAPRLPRFPAPVRTCTPAGRTVRCGPATTRAESRPRRTRDRRGDRAGAKRATGTTSAAASRAHDDEPATLVEHLAAAELRRELRAGEVALVHRPPRAVLEDAILESLAGTIGTNGCVDHDELRRDAPRLGQKPAPLVCREMSVEMPGENTVEREGVERKPVEDVSLDELAPWHSLPREVEHPLALVDPHDLSVQMPCEDARAAGHVQGACRR